MTGREEACRKAYDIAARDLRSRYTGKGILAGSKRFDDYWARDSFFASLGCLDLGDTGIVRKNLELFLGYQKDNGQLPRRIDRYIVGLKYLKLPVRRKRLKPKYTTSLFVSYSVDQNSLFIISLFHYLKKTKDKGFLKRIYNDAKKAMDWNFSNDRDNDLLIEEGYFANWEDTIIWRGRMLYTNVLHCWALQYFASISGMAGRKAQQKKYAKLAEKVKEKINNGFWGGSYYRKATRKTPLYFPVDANMLAVISGIADRKKAERIFRHMKESGLESETPLRCVHPRYPIWRNSPARVFTLSTGYHNACGWIWVSCTDILARAESGYRKDALRRFERLCRKVAEFRGVYEVYKKGRPVEGLFLMSDRQFAWSAGLFIHAFRRILDQGPHFQGKMRRE
ncbi:MAG: GH116 family glycosyl hydrolase [Candidatus Woesearchaeota archaeon]